MKRAFVTGHPIAQSRSPLIHGHWLAEHGLDGIYERLDVAPAAFESFLRGLPGSGYAGGNVTIPHKEAAFRLVDRLTTQAKRIGAVNTLIVEPDGGVRGDNTDALGFVAHLIQSLHARRGPDWSPSGLSGVTLLGAGGAARAIAVGLLEAGASRVRVINRNLDRAQALAEIEPGRIEPLPWESLPSRLPETDLLVNTTSLGMVGNDPLVLDLSRLPSTAIVADIVYVPLETRLLADARRTGLATVDGLGMLLHQAVPGFEAWFGVRPTVTERLRDVVVADLTAKSAR